MLGFVYVYTQRVSKICWVGWLIVVWMCSFGYIDEAERTEACVVLDEFDPCLKFQGLLAVRPGQFVSGREQHAGNAPAARRLGYRDLADVEEGVGPITIRRVNKERIINIQCNLTDRPLNEVVKELTQKLNAAGLKSSYAFSGQATTMNDSFAEMAMALSLSLLLIYLLLMLMHY